MKHHKEALQVCGLLHRDDAFDATVFIDEASFQLHRNTQVVWCPANKAPPKIVISHSFPSLTVLAGVPSVGTAPFVIWHGESLNAERFVESLSNDIELITNAFFVAASLHARQCALPQGTAYPSLGRRERRSVVLPVHLLSQPTAPRKYLVPPEGPGWAMSTRKVGSPRTTFRWGVDELTIDDVAPFWESMSCRIESGIDAAG